MYNSSISESYCGDLLENITIHLRDIPRDIDFVNSAFSVQWHFIDGENRSI